MHTVPSNSIQCRIPVYFSVSLSPLEGLSQVTSFRSLAEFLFLFQCLKSEENCYLRDINQVAARGLPRHPLVYEWVLYLYYLSS